MNDELIEFKATVMFVFAGKKYKQPCTVCEIRDELPSDRFQYINTVFMDLVFSVERDNYITSESKAKDQLVATILDYMKRQHEIELKKLERWNSGASLRL